MAVAEVPATPQATTSPTTASTWRTRREPTRCPAHHQVLTAVTSGHATVRKATTRSWTPNPVPPRPIASDATASDEHAGGRPGHPPLQGDRAVRGAPRTTATRRAGRTTAWRRRCAPPTSPVREGRGSAATARVATPPAASSTRPVRRAGTRAHAVTRWASPVSTSAVVMIHRCGVAEAASALIDSARASKPPGCTAAAQVHPPTRASTATVALSTAVRGRPTGSVPDAREPRWAPSTCSTARSWARACAPP